MLPRVLSVLRVDTQDRLKSAAGVAVFHALLGYALIYGLGIDVVGAAEERLKLFDVAEAPPPPPLPEPIPARERTKEKAERIKPAPKDPEGAAAPPNLKASPTQIAAPEPKIRLPVPPPITAAPVAGPGSESSAGASTRPGPGTGAGGQGTGLGSGASGSGAGGGGGGGAVGRPRCIRCELPSSVLPDRLLRMNLDTTVHVRFVIQPSGRVGGCRVMRSSGYPDLDTITCREIERRYRYRPARNEWGEPIAHTMSGPHEWNLRAEEDRWIEADIPDDR